MFGDYTGVKVQWASWRFVDVTWLVACALVICGLAWSAGAIASETITYTYDALGRLTKVESAGDVNNGQVTSTSYDPAGNRTNQQVTGAGTAPSYLAIDSVSATEGDNLVFTVTRTGNLATAVSVSYTIASGTATSGSDFTGSPDTLAFAANETSKTITIATVDDTSVEPAETMTVTLSGATGGAIISNATGTGTINDNDVAPAQFWINAARGFAVEGGSMAFTVGRTGTTSTAVSVNYATNDGTAIAGSDYTAASGTLQFAANETSKVVSISFIDDSTSEATETMSVVLSSPSDGAIITTATDTVMIIDNDTEVFVRVKGGTSWEGTSLIYGISLSQPAPATVSVDYQTVAGTATSGSDYQHTTGTVIFNPGESQKAVGVITVHDSISESDETVFLNLYNPIGLTISVGSAFGTIRNMNGPP